MLDANRAVREVDGVPPERLQLAAAQSRVERGRPERPIVGRGALNEKLTSLGRRDDANPATADSWDLNAGLSGSR